LSPTRRSACLKLGVVCGFRLCGRDIADRLEQAAVVEPIDPFEGGELDRLEGAPGAAPMDDLGLEETNHRFGESVVVGISDAADGRLDAGLGETLGVANAHILRPSVGMAHEPAAGEGPSLMKSLLQGVEDEVRPRRARHAPTDNLPGEDIDDEGDVDEAGPGRDIGEVGDPEHVRPRRLEDAVHPIERAWR